MFNNISYSEYLSVNISLIFFTFSFLFFPNAKIQPLPIVRLPFHLAPSSLSNSRVATSFLGNPSNTIVLSPYAFSTISSSSIDRKTSPSSIYLLFSLILQNSFQQCLLRFRRRCLLRFGRFSLFLMCLDNSNIITSQGCFFAFFCFYV